MASHQRDRILDAAVGVFAKRGYQATTVDNLVAASRIGVGSFYAHFEGKQECFLAAYDRIVASARERIVASLPVEAPLTGRICAALRTLLELIAAEPLAARLVIVEAQTAGSEGLARYQRTFGELAPELRRLRPESPFADELPATLEEATLGGAAWLLHQRLVAGEARNVEQLLPDLVEIVLGPYMGEDAAAALLAAA